MQRPLVLAILDGWGYRAEREANAIAQARKPNYDRLLREYPNTLLHASDHFVGLPDGQMGNSEVGHLNIGAGRVVSMDITRIDAMIANGSFYEHPEIVRAIDRACEGGRQLHLLGLLSNGGVHSQQAHLHALLRTAKMRGAERVYVHAFLDGRDTLPTSGAGYLETLERAMQEIGVGKLATVSGRYYAMDRDRRWERERLTFDAMVKGTAEGGAHRDAIARVKESYSQGMTDEFVVPFVVSDATGAPVARVRDEDSCICFNYRADRVRQITRVLARESGLTADGGRELPGAEDLDKTIPRTGGSEEAALSVNDAVRQALQSAHDSPAGVDGEPAGEPAGRGATAQPARGGDGEVCARHILLQWRHRKGISGRRPADGAVAEGRDLRLGSGDERARHRGSCQQGSGGYGIPTRRRELSRMPTWWDIRASWSRPSAAWRPWTHAWGRSIRRCGRRAAPC